MKRVLAVAACAMVMVGFGATQRVEAAAPIINSLSPNTKEAGSGTFVMTVSGSNFTTGSVVKWNGSSVSTGYVSSTQLSATVGSSQVVSTGTANVTVQTSGRKGGTSNTLTFTITVPTVTAPPPPPPPPPAPSPLAITTSSLPGGTAGTPLSATVAATGGTPSYGWALVNGGGALPPGLTLQATGTVSGTPTQSGTFTFTTQANDAASQIAQKVLSITVAADPTTPEPPPPTTGGTILFQTGFENGSATGGFERIINTTDVSINSDPQFVRTGSYSGKIHYKICGASDGTCGGSSQDTNRYFAKDFNSNNGYPNGLETLYVRAYVYFKSPEPGGAKDGVQRKIMWWADSTSQWSFFISSDSKNGVIPVRFSTNGNAFVSPYTFWDITTLTYDTWYCLEVGATMNTPGVADGTATVWVNGTQVMQKTGLNLRGSYTTGIQYFSPGRQTNRYNYNPIEEYRYWDDIVISTSYIGP